MYSNIAALFHTCNKTPVAFYSIDIYSKSEKLEHKRSKDRWLNLELLQDYLLS